MNKRQAMEKGYQSTGVYSHDKEEVKTRITREKAEGNRAVLVPVPASPLSRGHSGGGWAMWRIESADNKIARLIAIKERRVRQLNQKITDLKYQIADLEKERDEL